MLRRRRRTRSAIPRPIKKYSNETYGFQYNSSLALATAGIKLNAASVMVPAAQNILGMRKCKNFTFRLACSAIHYKQSGSEEIIDHFAPVIFALVYVPEGLEPHTLNVGGEPTSIFEPNQNVILSGIVKPDYPVTISSRLARNLNSGDMIVFIAQVQFPLIANGDHYDIDFVGTLNYAVTF